MTMGLDSFGYPAVTIANTVLAKLESFGDSTEELEESWFDWLQHNPFDMVVAAKLEQLLIKKLELFDPDTDAGAVERVERKLQLIRQRLQRYQPEDFSG